MSNFHRLRKPIPDTFLSKTKTANYLYVMDPDTRRAMAFPTVFVNTTIKPTEDENKEIVALWMKNYPGEALTTLQVASWSQFSPPPVNGPGKSIKVLTTLRFGQGEADPHFFFAIENTGYVILVNDIQNGGDPVVIEQFVNPSIPILTDEAEAILEFWKTKRPDDQEHDIEVYSVKLMEPGDEEMLYHFEGRVRTHEGMISVTLDRYVAPVASVDGVYGEAQ